MQRLLGAIEMQFGVAMAIDQGKRLVRRGRARFAMADQQNLRCPGWWLIAVLKFPLARFLGHGRALRQKCPAPAAPTPPTIRRAAFAVTHSSTAARRVSPATMRWDA